MLRTVVAGVAVLIFLAIASIAVQDPGARGPALVFAIIVAGILFERSRYRMWPSSDRQGLTRTNERFVDPETGKTMTVWIGAAGDRHYLED